MIESKDNEKLKLVRKLHVRKHRERQGLFATEGEDLLGGRPGGGGDSRGSCSSPGAPACTARIRDPARRIPSTPCTRTCSTRSPRSAPGPARSPCGRRSPRGTAPVAPCVYLDGVGDPGNVGAIIRTAHALLDATVALGPGCTDPFSPKATRASMGSLFARPPLTVAGVEETPEPRVALVAHGGEGLEALAGAATLCLGAEREGLRPEVVAACDATVTIPLRGGTESLNVAAAAAVACARMSEVRADA